MLNRFPKRHVLTIALEDYFHGPAFRNLISRERWTRFETRFERNCLVALDLLDRTQSTATFFVRGWVAQARPDMVREIVDRGHEIASSGNLQKSFRQFTREELREDLRASRAMIEDASGKRVLGYRVSDPYMDPSHLWGLEVLAEEGYAYDSSLSPAFWRFRKEAGRRFLHAQPVGDKTIWEVPLSSLDVAGFLVPIAGGNYFRQFPESFVRRAIDRWDRTCPHPFVSYFRLWDLDPLQPKINTGSFVREIRHYRNADKMTRLLNDMLSKYSFESIAGHLHLTPAASPRPAASAEVIEIRTRPRALDRVPVSIVVPCYNEEVAIPYLANTLEELGRSLDHQYDLEFILVDDGSSDRTWSTLEQHFGHTPGHTPGYKLIRHRENQGVSAAILSGIRAGREIVCSMDCDCTYDPHELKAMIPLILAGADLVTASPYHPNGKVVNVPVWRLGISRVASGLYRAVTGRQLHTFTSCLRAYRRSAVLETTLEHGGFLGVAELISKLALEGAVIAEHPATLEVRIFGQSKMKIARTTLGHLRLLTKLARRRFQLASPAHTLAAAIPSGVRTAEPTLLRTAASPTPSAAASHSLAASHGTAAAPSLATARDSFQRAPK